MTASARWTRDDTSVRFVRDAVMKARWSSSRRRVDGVATKRTARPREERA
jgi:hypothetical protein